MAGPTGHTLRTGLEYSTAIVSSGNSTTATSNSSGPGVVRFLRGHAIDDRSRHGRHPPRGRHRACYPEGRRWDQQGTMYSKSQPGPP